MSQTTIWIVATVAATIGVSGGLWHGRWYGGERPWVPEDTPVGLTILFCALSFLVAGGFSLIVTAVIGARFFEWLERRRLLSRGMADLACVCIAPAVVGYFGGLGVARALGWY